MYDIDREIPWCRGPQIFPIDRTRFPSPLYYASLAGFHHVLEHLVLDADVDAQGGIYGNALQAASSGGHETIVRLLLENGADVNVWGG
ncbi:hypothetical protein GALMADRAFT_58158, partial [Galerina marginata CBS 339.88]